MPDVFTSIRHNLDLIISLAARHRVPAIYPYRFMIGACRFLYGIRES
jgi:hypothetical protein